MSTVVELRKVAKENGLKGYSKMKKDELIELLKGVKKEEKAPIKKSRMTKNKDVHVLTPREKKEKKKKEEEEKDEKYILDQTKNMSEGELEKHLDKLKNTYEEISDPYFHYNGQIPKKRPKFNHPASFYLKIGASLAFPKIQDDLKKGYFSTKKNYRHWTDTVEITEDMDIRELYKEIKSYGKGGWTLALIDTVTKFEKFLPENILEIVTRKEKEKERKEKEKKQEEKERYARQAQKSKALFEAAKEQGFL